MAHWLCVCVVLLVGIGSLEIAHGFLFPTSSVAPSSPSCVGGSTESDLTLVCNLQYQLTHLLKRYKKSGLAFNPVFYGTELNNTLTATDDCRLPFHNQLNVYNHLFDRVRGLYAPTNRFTRLTNRTTQAIASLQDKLKESCKAHGEDGCSDMNRNQIPAEASNAAIRTDEGEDAANDWGLVLVETLLKRLEPLDNGCSGSSRKRRRRGERKDRTKKNRRRGGRKNRRQKKDKKADQKTKDRSGKKGGRAERREKRRRNRKKRVDDDNSTEVNNTITATTTNTNTTTNNDNNDKVGTDASEHAVGISSTNDVEQVNINVDNGKDSRSSDSDGEKNRRNRRRDRKNKNKRRNRKNRDKKRRKSKGRRNRRRKSSSS